MHETVQQETEGLETIAVTAPALGAWTALATFAREATDAPRATATFTRLTTLHPERLAGLPQWWRAVARNGRVHAARGLVLDALTARLESELVPV